MAETLNLSGLSGYRVGGTVHVVINNQLGFTTAPEAARTSVYPTDVAKMVQAPIFHVNGDDPEACVRAARLAFGFRQAFHKDVVIDLVCYRRHGHNEGDDPSYTQPLMYQRIEAKRSVRKLYTEALVRRGDITLEEAEQALDDFNSQLQTALDEVRAETPPPPPHLPTARPVGPADPGRRDRGRPRRRCVSLADDDHEPCRRASPSTPSWPASSPSGTSWSAGGQVDWALGEALAVGSLLLEGVDVRLTGQDTRRGTFSQRHAVLVDYATGAEYVPLAHLDRLEPAGRHRAGRHRAGQRRSGPNHPFGRFTVRDSLLSEYAAVGFEYGYSVEAPDALVAWEAQFGDFVNGAEIIIDNFIVAAEDKWGQHAGLVLLLPHGYEGQGPEHSSARLERFLSLSARGNLRVTVPSTAAQYFHLLRAQVRRAPVTPLVVITPEVDAAGRGLPLAAGRPRRRLVRRGDRRRRGGRPGRGAAGRAVQREGGPRGPAPPRRAAGRPGARAGGNAERASGSAPDAVAVVRVEQLYPWPEDRHRAGARAVRRRHRGGLAAGGAREHGRLVVRPRPAPPAPARTATRCATSAGRSRPARPPGAAPSTSSSRPISSIGRSADRGAASLSPAAAPARCLTGDRHG